MSPILFPTFLFIIIIIIIIQCMIVPIWLDVMFTTVTMSSYETETTAACTDYCKILCKLRFHTVAKLI